MTDHLTVPKRSWNMSRIRSKNTKPEIAVRKMLHQNGIRYRLHAGDLPGKPDISNKKKKFAVFINGCFWHQHPGCRRATVPKTNADYWKPKLKKNSMKVIDDVKIIQRMGYSAFTIWECEVNDHSKINTLIKTVKSL